MTTARWNPEQYLRFADERSRPFYDLVGRIDAPRPDAVADLGCGPGQLTASLLQRWPDAKVTGVDSSAEMLAKASEHRHERLRFELADLTTWQPAERYDVIMSNATLQWVEGHDALLGRLVGNVAPGGWFAFQVPANFSSASHTNIAELVTSPPWRERIDAAVLQRPASFPIEHYLACLTDLGCAVDGWATTYYHQLQGPDPVFNWVKGTALRPVLAALQPGDVDRFETELKARLLAAYPARNGITTLPFLRIFVVAQVPG